MYPSRPIILASRSRNPLHHAKRSGEYQHRCPVRGPAHKADASGAGETSPFTAPVRRGAAAARACSCGDEKQGRKATRRYPGRFEDCQNRIRRPGELVRYQSSLTAAANSINKGDFNVSVGVSGYLLEELRDPDDYVQFQEDLATANVFTGSLIFVQDLA